MIIDGKQIAREIKDELKAEFSGLSKKPKLDIIYAGQDPAIESFMKIKLRAAEEVGVYVEIHRFPDTISKAELLAEIKKNAEDISTDGIVIQLPLPDGIDTTAVLNAVPPDKDVDVLSEKAFQLFADGKTKLVPPVAGAVMEILARNGIELKGKRVAVLGRGLLVGKPVIVCMERESVELSKLDRSNGDPTPYLQTADIVISGIGQPHFIKPEMLKEGAVLIDAGTSEKGGGVAGDADPSCAAKCSLFTPVPGGLGPIMITMLFKNLLELLKNK